MKPGIRLAELKKKKWIWLILGVAVLFILPGLYCGLTVRHYEIRDEKIRDTVRIALITDLHSCKYGKGQEKLLAAISKQNPDIILLGGDVFDDNRPDDHAIEFLAGISWKYPCFYVTGNHECWLDKQEFQKKMEILDQYGIVRLAGETVTLTMGGNEILLCGVDDPHIVLIGAADTKRKHLSYDAEYSAVAKEITEKPEAFSILLAHRPELFETYAESGFDLALAGHAHGGQWRIPVILNGYFAPNQGLFPKYAGGHYEKNGSEMIVSRGLARESTPVPRFYNPPELVIIDLKNTTD